MELQARLQTLSTREREVLTLMASGIANKRLAARIGVAETTLRIHRGRVMKKMGAKTLPDLVKMVEVLERQGNAAQSRRR